MSDPNRIALVVAVVAVALAVARITRSGVAIRRRRVEAPVTATLPVLFTSETCSTCDRVRRLISDLDAGSVAEVIWERDRADFERAGVDRVPVLMWKASDGSVWRVDGVPSLRRMKRWLDGARLGS